MKLQVVSGLRFCVVHVRLRSATTDGGLWMAELTQEGVLLGMSTQQASHQEWKGWMHQVKASVYHVMGSRGSHRRCPRGQCLVKGS